MPYRLVDEPGFKGGVNKEIPSWLLPAGSLADATNLIFDKPGMARQRGGTTALSALGSQSAFGTTLGWAYSRDATAIEELYAANGATGGIYLVNKATGTSTLVATATAGTFGRAIRHYGFLHFPCDNATFDTSVVAGATTNSTFASTATSSITAGSPQFTLTGADVTTTIRVGQIVTGFTGGPGAAYYGRVVSVDTTKIFSVWPVPTLSMSFPGGNVTAGAQIHSQLGGLCGASFQGRLLLGNTYDMQAYNQSGRVSRSDRRVNFSPLWSEQGLFTSSTLITSYGATWISSLTWPLKNFFEVPGADPIVAMEPVDDNELLILTGGTPYIFRGQLASQTTTFAPGISFDISPLNTNASCLTDLSVQRTPHGIVWASTEGIMLYSGGGRLADLTEDRYHTAWRDLTRGSNFVVHGSAYVRNHYVVSGVSGSSTFVLAFNLDNGTVAPLSSALDVYYGSGRPSDPSQVFGLRWGAGSFTNGQVVRLDSAFGPDVWGQSKTDADGSVVAFSGTSRSITDDSTSERFVRRLIVRSQSQMTNPNVAVAIGARLDSMDTDGRETATVGSLSNTSVLTVTGATNTAPITITTSAAHGLQSEDQVDVHLVGGNTNANGRWRITATGTTTFSLNQSSGNSAYTSGGDVKRITEQEFTAANIDIGQATFVKLDSASTVNRFEWHGFRVGVMEITRGMG